MQLLAPDILAATRELSPSILVAILLLGGVLWLFGGRTHRFWLALAVTVAAGMVGLQVSGDFGVQPLVAALLLALSAGSLALSLARVGVFVAGGIAVLTLARSIATGWNDYLCFMAGGLAGILLFPLWVSILSSAAGAVVMAHATVSLLDQLLGFDATVWAEQNGPLINWAIGSIILLGVFIQYALERLRRKGRQEKEEKKADHEEQEGHLPVPLPAAPSSRKTPWWKLPVLFGRKNKAA